MIEIGKTIAVWHQATCVNEETGEDYTATLCEIGMIVSVKDSRVRMELPDGVLFEFDVKHVVIGEL